MAASEDVLYIYKNDQRTDEIGYIGVENQYINKTINQVFQEKGWTIPDNADKFCIMDLNQSIHEYGLDEIITFQFGATGSAYVSYFTYKSEPQPVTKARFKAYINGQQMGVYTETAI